MNEKCPDGVCARIYALQKAAELINEANIGNRRRDTSGRGRDPSDRSKVFYTDVYLCGRDGCTGNFGAEARIARSHHTHVASINNALSDAPVRCALGIGSRTNVQK